MPARPCSSTSFHRFRPTPIDRPCCFGPPRTSSHTPTPFQVSVSVHHTLAQGCCVAHRTGGQRAGGSRRAEGGGRPPGPVLQLFEGGLANTARPPHWPAQPPLSHPSSCLQVTDTLDGTCTADLALPPSSCHHQGRRLPCFADLEHIWLATPLTRPAAHPALLPPLPSLRRRLRHACHRTGGGCRPGAVLA